MRREAQTVRPRLPTLFERSNVRALSVGKTLANLVPTDNTIEY